MSNNQKNYLKKLKKEKIIINIIRLLLIFILLLSWELAAKYKIINSFIFSSPSKIISTIISLYQQHNLFNNIFTTTKEILISFTLGFFISIVVASILYLSNFLYKILDPIITIINSLPKVALGPILLIWFGANQKTIIIMALLINLIVSIVTIYTGFIKTDPNLIKLFKSYKVNKFKTLLYLVIPNSKKNIISSLKLNISMSLIGVITGEFLVSKEGIGYLIIYGTQIFDLNLVMSGLIILILLSSILYIPISLLEKTDNT